MKRDLPLTLIAFKDYVQESTVALTPKGVIEKPGGAVTLRQQGTDGPTSLTANSSRRKRNGGRP